MGHLDEPRSLVVTSDILSLRIQKISGEQFNKPFDIGGKMRSIKMYPLRSTGVIFWKQFFWIYYKPKQLSEIFISFLRLMRPQYPIHKCYCHHLLVVVSERIYKSTNLSSEVGSHIKEFWFSTYTFRDPSEPSPNHYDLPRYRPANRFPWKCPI